MIAMNNILQDLFTPALVTAIEANMFDFFRMFSHWPQAEFHDDPELLWTMTDIPFPMFNNRMRAKFTLEDVAVAAAIEAAIARCQANNVPMLWLIGPTTMPTDLGARLETYGFLHTENAAGMAVDLQALNEDIPIPAGFTIEKVKDSVALKTWFRPFIAGFGIADSFTDPFIDLYECAVFGAGMPLHAYTGWLNGEPVASSSLYYGAGVAGIYDVATVPEARRQGIGALMTLAPLRDARAMGYRAGILHGSEMGSNVYRRLGFQEYCSIGQYVWRPEHEQ